VENNSVACTSNGSRELMGGKLIGNNILCIKDIFGCHGNIGFSVMQTFST